MTDHLIANLTLRQLFTRAIYCAHHGYNGGEGQKSCSCSTFTECREIASIQAARLLEYLERGQEAQPE